VKELAIKRALNYHTPGKNLGSLSGVSKMMAVKQDMNPSSIIEPIPVAIPANGQAILKRVITQNAMPVNIGMKS
jgi:hypothetical protein